MKSYTQSEINGIMGLIWEAEQIVTETIKEQNITDSGTCVLGGGIKLMFLAPRKRIPTPMTLIRSPFQGNMSNSQALKPAVAFLKSRGVECYYDDGNMD